jgi:hypothetical protein
MSISNISLLDIAIIALFVWRWSSLLVDEDGLFGMFERVRTWIGVRYTKGSTGELEQVVPDDVPWLRKAIAKWFTCRWCCSMWVGVLSAIAYVIWNEVTFVMLPWSISTLAIIVDAIVGRRYRRRVYFE